MHDTQRPSSLGYSSSAIDRATFKKYWLQLSSVTVLPRAGAEVAIFPPAVGPAAGAAGSTLPKLRAGSIRAWPATRLRKACRERSVPCSNKSQPAELIQKLTDAGWVLP